MLMQPKPIVAKSYNMNRQEEKQREGYVPQSTPSAALSAHSNYSRNNHKEGHSSEECYKIMGYPIGHPLHGKYKPIAQKNNILRTLNMTQTSVNAGNSKEQLGVGSFNSAIVDSGATDHDHHKRIAHGTLCNGLYIIKQEEPTPQSLALSINNHNHHLWHVRLGHPAYSVLQQTDSISLPRKCTVPSNSCTICPLDKQHALHFQSSDSHADNLFDLVHIDV
nr:cysteine-rich RLK (receptor-like protein kinase) 8 [Tanacetum cinerariifolium]